MQVEKTIWLLILVLLLGAALGALMALSVQRHRLRRHKVELDDLGERFTRLLGTMHGELPAWLKAERLLAERPAPGEQESLARLRCLLDTLETLIARVAQQPCLTRMLEGSPVPAFIAHRGRLVEVNTAFQYAVGRHLSVQDGFALGDLMCTDSGVAPSGSMVGRVAVSNSQGGCQHFQLYMLDDSHHHCLGLLEDDREQQRHTAQLTLSRDQARQEASLRGDYLQMLQKELNALVQDAEAVSTTHPELAKRLSDLDILATHLAGVAPRFSAAWQQTTEIQRPRVLIVDDGPVSTMLARQALEAAGMDVDTASSGEEALRMREDHYYDVVLMDIIMAGIDGLEAARRWREHERLDGRRSALVAFSANTEESDRQDFSEVGMDDYLAKPYRPKQLVKKVRCWIGARPNFLP